MSRCEPLWPTVTCLDGWNPKPKRKKREEDITDDVPTSNSKTIFSTKGTWGKKCVRFGFKKFRYASKRLGSIQFTLDGNPILFGINNIEYWHSIEVFSWLRRIVCLLPSTEFALYSSLKGTYKKHFSFMTWQEFHIKNRK